MSLPVSQLQLQPVGEWGTSVIGRGACCCRVEGRQKTRASSMKRNPSSSMKRSTLNQRATRVFERCNSVNSFRHDSSHTALGRSSLPKAQHRKHQSLLKSTMETVLSGSCPKVFFTYASASASWSAAATPWTQEPLLYPQAYEAINMNL